MQPITAMLRTRELGTGLMESDLRYYNRRIDAERLAAARALTVEARERRLRLVESYLRKIEALTA